MEFERKIFIYHSANTFEITETINQAVSSMKIVLSSRSFLAFSAFFNGISTFVTGSDYLILKNNYFEMTAYNES